MEQTQEPQIPEPLPTDIGTRLDHLTQYRDSLETCIEIVKARPYHTDTQQKLIKFAVALEVLNVTIDSFSGYIDRSTEYNLYRLLNSVPKNAEQLLIIGGKPLNEGDMKDTNPAR